MTKTPMIVDITEKSTIIRRASASGVLCVSPTVVSKVHEGATEKGDVRNSASLAAILAVKKTPLSLPHCHPIPIEGCTVEWKDVENGLKCIVTVSTTSKTGVEMEALCGVSTALLCAWDMLKPILKDSTGQYPDTRISDVAVITKLKIPTEN